MENTRYDYSPLIKRKPFKLPNQAKVALWVVVNIEYFDIGATSFMGVNVVTEQLPNVWAYALRDYEHRVGIWRVMEVLDKHNIQASVSLNSDVCHHYPIIIEEGKKRGWEFMGHGTSNAILLVGKSETEERQIITTCLDVITRAVGQRPKGWVSPGVRETFNTPDILASEGIEYLCDWCSDDQPYPMKVKSGRLISIPYASELNDFPAFSLSQLTPRQFYEMITDHFDVLYQDSSDQAFVMCIGLHPFLIGQPHRLRWLDKALDYIRGHKGVWFARGCDIASWYYENYVDKKR